MGYVETGSTIVANKKKQKNNASRSVLVRDNDTECWICDEGLTSSIVQTTD